MTIIDRPTETDVWTTERLRTSANNHLWRQFTDMTTDERNPLRIMVKGEGCYLEDSEGNRYLDAMSALFCVNIGYSYGDEIGEAVAEQYRQLPYANTWGTTHPGAIKLAEKIASLAPDHLNHVFFTPSGGESVEAAWKIARQYHRLRGENRWKAISRTNAYHGTTLGALALMGISNMRSVFEPVVSGGVPARNTGRLVRPAGETDAEFTAFLLEDMEERILEQDPSTVAMIILEPIQLHGGYVPPVGYPEGMRALCDKYGILLVIDETVTAWGRVGEWFASHRYAFDADIITSAKGLSSAYAVLGCVVASDAVFDTFQTGGKMFAHGMTFGGHPASTAAALKNIEIMERDGLIEHVRDKEAELGSTLKKLLDLPIVADVRGNGYMWTVELTSIHADGTPFTEDDLNTYYGGESIGKPLTALKVLMRSAVEGGDATFSIAPPLIADTVEFDRIESALRQVLTPLSAKLGL